MSKSIIQKKFEALQENYTPVNVIKYIDFLRTRPATEVLENAKYVFVEPTMGAEFMLETVQNLPDGHISLMESVYEGQFRPYVTRAMNEGYENMDHLKKVYESADALYDRLDRLDIKEDTVRILQEQLDTIEGYITSAMESSKEVNENIGTMAPDIVYAEEDCDTLPLQKKKAELDFSINFVKTFMDETEEINLESFNAMMRAGYRYDNLVEQEAISEGVGDAVKGAAIKANNGMRKVANKIRKGSNERHRVGVAVKKIPQHVDSLVTNTIGQISKMDKNERRKRIIEGGFKFKLFKIIRNAILVGAAWMISPALAAIGILTHLILDRQLDNKVRDELLDELEMELKMTREKLKDAEQKGDQKKKYQLMRIENALDKDIKRVRFRLNTIKVSKNGGVRV